jgi:hypothetical protein
MLNSDFVTLTEFARYGITPPAAPDFVPESVNIPPLRERYLKVRHTVNYLLYQQYLAKTMIILDTNVARTIPGIHFSPQHQADSKGKPEGRVIGDLSGQHDAAYTPLNGTSASKDALRQVIADKWGEIKHPTIVQLVRMVRHPWLGQYYLVEERSQRSFQSPQLQPRILSFVCFSSVQQCHHDTPGRSFRLDWNPTCLSGTHKIITGYVFPYHLRIVSLVR